MNSEAISGFCFGEFELDPARRLLLRQGEPVKLNSKTFDLLSVLVANHDRVLSRNELLDRVWESRFVEENNLSVHIAALRKALGESKNDHRYIVTVPGKGYQFVAEINTPSNGDFVVETHTFEKIVVEEEITSDNGHRSNADPRLALAGPTGRRWLWFGVPAAVIVLFGASVWYYNSQPARNVVAEPQLNSRIFATAGGIPHRVAIAPDGRSIAYVQRFKGQDSIWIGDLRSGNSIQLTEASTRLHEFMTFGPDGRSIYFTARDESHPVWTLMRVSTFGGAVTDLVKRVNGSVSFSPDGKQLVFLRKNETDGRSHMIIADAETGQNEKVHYGVGKPQAFLSSVAAWHPAGNVIAASLSNENGKGCEVITVNVADASVSKLGEESCHGRTNLAWLHDGTALVMTSGQPESTKVWLISYPAGEKRQITNDTLNYGNYSLSVSADDRVAVLANRSDPKIWVAEGSNLSDTRQILEGSRLRAEGSYGLAIAPDGKILYSARVGDSRTVWEMNSEGNEQRQLTASQTRSHDAIVNVTADGRYIVFESGRSGKTEIWRANRDGSDLVQLTNGGISSAPDLEPGGEGIVFTETREGRSTLSRISINGGEPTRLTDQQSEWPAVSPDGKYIACSYRDSPDAVGNVIAILPIAGGRPVKVFQAATNGILYNRLRWSPDGRSVIYKDIVQGLWRQDLNKEKPEPVMGVEDVRVFHFAFSADGKLVYSGGIPMREIVILENFRPTSD
ncbi:MAG TPA: winged helix-turn-helix domain-containing protein [Pyrinomonadaceae bacterium]|nr:winged helix-turn-helix domain-containing protein [Pyrinomonadaceae bacterium]